MQGVQDCMGAGYRHEPSSHNNIWQKGSAKLLDYAPHASHRPAVFIIPSLINKSYILDLLPDASFIQHLKHEGYRPLMLDWGTPGDAESDFACNDYLQAYAASALAYAREHHDGPIILMGYCMGGIFALSLAQLTPIAIDGLMLIATPWDFASDDTAIALLNPATQEIMRHWLSSMNPVPPAFIQMIFHWLNPNAAFEKFLEFPNLGEKEQARFAAIEHWSQDGVPISSAVARECFVDWPQKNLLKTHRFSMGRKWLEPGHIACPSLLLAAKRDKIVPLNCAKPLAKELKRAMLVTPDTGHVGMVAGLRAPELCWSPITDWLNQHFK